jgi:hypothetical protein
MMAQGMLPSDLPLRCKSSHVSPGPGVRDQAAMGMFGRVIRIDAMKPIQMAILTRRSTVKSWLNSKKMDALEKNKAVGITMVRATRI